jgi:hypothetical protein
MMARLLFQAGVLVPYGLLGVGGGLGDGWGEYGLLGIVLGVVLFRDIQRERESAKRHKERDDQAMRLQEAHSKRLDELQEWIRDSLQAALRENSHAMRTMLDKCPAWPRNQGDPK